VVDISPKRVEHGIKLLNPSVLGTSPFDKGALFGDSPPFLKETGRI